MASVSDFVGRTDELGALDAALDAVEQGVPQTVEVVGPAGIGKTRLLAELTARANRRGQIVLTGAGAELEQDLPFWVFVDALDEYVEGLDPRRLQRLDQMVRSELSQVLPALSDAAAAPRPALHERYRMHRAMRELLEQLAATKPLVLILDDFHWADQASTDLLVAVLHRPPAAGVLIVLAARPRQIPPRLAAALDRAHRDGTLERLELGALTREEARRLVGDAVDDIYHESGGNAFYLEQLARAPRAPRGPTARGDVALAGLQVPPMVAASLTEELGWLSVPARQALDAASVAGDPFDIEFAAVAAGVSEPALLEAIDALTRLDLLRETDVPRRFRFRHPIVRRAVYEVTPRGWRLGAHERIADALATSGAGPATRAHHVERSARAGDGAAIEVLRDAGKQSALRAPATAARWFGAALRLLPETAPARERVELLLAQAQALAATGRFVDSRAALLESIATVPADARALRAQLAATCARVEHLLGQHEQAHDRLLQALDTVDDQGSPEALSLMIELAMDGSHRMDYAAMEDWGARAAETGRRLDDPVLAATGVAAYARAAAFAGAAQEAEAACSEAALLVDALSDDELARRLDAAVHLAGGELYRARFGPAGAHAERALAVGRATGQGQLFPLIYAILGMVWLVQGRLVEAVEPLDAAVEAARTTANAQTLAWSLFARSAIALAAGDVETALSTGEEAFDVSDDGKPSHVAGWASFALAGALLEIGNAERAASLLERSTGGADMPRVAPSWRAFALELLTRCRLALGQIEEAGRAAACAEIAAEAVDLSLARVHAGRAGAAVALASGDDTRALELALAAADRADAAGIAIDAALARTLAGRALARLGETDRAVEHLERAAAELQARGALRARDAAEFELRQLGRRIHRRSQPAGTQAGAGVDSLTRRELEIARLVVDRRTNKEIAEALFLSPRTIETHLRNIFAKLGADSRVEVARTIERADRRARSAT